MGSCERAFELISQTQRIQLKPDAPFLTSCLFVCSRAKDLERGEAYFKLFKKFNLKLDAIVFNNMLKICSRVHNVEKAWQYFNLMKTANIEPTIVT